jgi:hypothetical protein
MGDRHLSQVRMAFQGALETTNPKVLLLAAEAGGQNGGGFDGACIAVATAIGYPLSEHRSNRTFFRSAIATYMITLQPQAIAGHYNWYF